MWSAINAVQSSSRYSGEDYQSEIVIALPMNGRNVVALIRRLGFAAELIS